MLHILIFRVFDSSGEIAIYLEEDRIIQFKDLEIEGMSATDRLQILTANTFNMEKISFKEYSYLKELINLYSDLALSRNYLWKTFLSEIFDSKFLFRQMWNDKLPIDIRSALTKLALSIKIDQEPLNLLQVPVFTRCYELGFEKGGKQAIGGGSFGAGKVGLFSLSNFVARP